VTLLVLLAQGCGGGPAADGAGAEGPVPPCGTGTWRPGTLEIHHIDLGQADSTLVVGPTGRTLLIDAGETSWESSKGARTVGAYVEQVLGCRRLDAVLVTHFHLDHVGYVGKGGLWHLVNVQGFAVGTTLHRDVRAFVGEAGSTLLMWREYLAGAGSALLHPQVARAGRGQVELGPEVSFRIVAVDGQGALRPGDFGGRPQAPSENDYSVAAHLRWRAFDYFDGGDLSGELALNEVGPGSHDIETGVARALPDIDVYRANHHGSDHSSNATFLAQIDPEVSIVSVGDSNGYGHPRPRTLARLLATGAVYLTERGDPRTDIGGARVGGTVVVRSSDGRSYTVNGDGFAASDPLRLDADGDGYFQEADPDDSAAGRLPGPSGGCDPLYQPCGGAP
jgi:hypothetical protein